MKLMTLLLLLLGPWALAQEVALYSWSPSSQHVSWVIPVFKEESPKDSVTRYLNSVSGDKKAVNLLTDKNLKQLKQLLSKSPDEAFQKISSSEEIRVGLVANAKQDYSKNQIMNRVFLFEKYFKQSGASPLLVPSFHDAGLNQRQADAFRQALSERFKVLVVMGGADIHPSLYGEPIKEAVGTHLERDQSEARLLKSYLQGAQEQGNYCVGVCRGHQFLGVLSGMKLKQEINIPDETSINHRKDKSHSIDVKPRSLLARIFEKMGIRKPAVNTYHHQAVLFSEGKGVVLTATAPDGTVESIQGKRFLGIQFHPEFMPDIASDFFTNILSFVKGAKMSCQRAL